MQKVDILGVNVHKVTLNQSAEIVNEWLRKRGKHFIVTPNIEFIMAAQSDQKFRSILNKADLNIPDSSRFNWVIDQLEEQNLFLKLIKWPFFIYPRAKFLKDFPVVGGVDLMEELIDESCKRGYTVGFLGGRNGVADKLKECLLKKYPKLKVVYTNSSLIVNADGKSKKINIPSCDILFVAFGHIKQEKWIYNNLTTQPVKVMMGVGGSFDYLSGSVKRAPKLVQRLGFEWLFRLVLQPWRIKRFLELIKFVFIVFKTTNSSK